MYINVKSTEKIESIEKYIEDSKEYIVNDLTRIADEDISEWEYYHVCPSGKFEIECITQLDDGLFAIDTSTEYEFGYIAYKYSPDAYTKTIDGTIGFRFYIDIDKDGNIQYRIEKDEIADLSCNYDDYY